ncbi:LOW QUALITY PROTEIN: uncharacterized protein V5649_002844 [Rhynchonycteris naso]
MAASTLSVCSSDLSYGSRVCLPGSCDSCTDSSCQVDDCPESCCEPSCCAPSCCQPTCCTLSCYALVPTQTLICIPVRYGSNPCQSTCTSSCIPLCCQQSSSQPSCCTSSFCQQVCCVPICCKPVCCKPVCSFICSQAIPCPLLCCRPSSCVSLIYHPVCSRPACCVPVFSCCAPFSCQPSCYHPASRMFFLALLPCALQPNLRCLHLSPEVLLMTRHVSTWDQPETTGHCQLPEMHKQLLLSAQKEVASLRMTLPVPSAALHVESQCYTASSHPPDARRSALAALPDPSCTSPPSGVLPVLAWHLAPIPQDLGQSQQW